MQFQIPISEFLAGLQAGKITINVSRDAQGDDTSTWTKQNYDDLGNRLDDTTYPVPLRVEIQAHIAELQDTLAKSQAEIPVIETDIAQAQAVDKLYDDLAPKG